MPAPQSLCLDPNDPNHARRQQFYEEVLKATPSAPESDFPRLCRAWQVATDADWTWFWLYNPFSSRWELTCPSPHGGQDIVPPSPVNPTSESAAEYCVATGRPVFIADLRGWRSEHGGRV